MDYLKDQQVVTLSRNANASLAITFLIDTIAFEPDETFVLDLSVNSITPAASAALLDASLINVFFRSRQNFIIQDSTGKYNNYTEMQYMLGFEKRLYMQR